MGRIWREMGRGEQGPAHRNFLPPVEKLKWLTAGHGRVKPSVTGSQRIGIPPLDENRRAGRRPRRRKSPTTKCCGGVRLRHHREEASSPPEDAVVARKRGRCRRAPNCFAGRLPPLDLDGKARNMELNGVQQRLTYVAGELGSARDETQNQ